jgi:hypothetical protein
VGTAYKSRGGLLGPPGPTDGCPQADGVKGQERALEGRQANDGAAYADPAPVVAVLRVEGLALRRIADRINVEGHTTRRDAVCNAVQIARLLERDGG